MGAVALGAQRLLPAMQQAYNAWATINSYSSEISKVLDSLSQKIEKRIENIQFNSNFKNLNKIKEDSLRRS